MLPEGQPVHFARSAVDAYCYVDLQLMMPAETARDTIAALGQAGQLQFKDLCEDKSPLQRTFANQVLSAFPCDHYLLEVRVGVMDLCSS